jgi:hypothetical protein
VEPETHEAMAVADTAGIFLISDASQAVIAFAMAAFLGVIAARLLLRVRETRSWPEIRAKVTSCETFEIQSRSRDVGYTVSLEYAVEGVIYHNSFSSHTRAEGEMTIQVNPSDPAEFSNEPSSYTNPLYVGALALGAFLYGVAMRSPGG